MANYAGYEWSNGRAVHRWVWEQKNGPIPSGGIIHHIDGDRTNNAIENLMGSVRRVTRNIKRWRNKNAMLKRWMALAISTAQRRFKRLKGHKDMPALVAALRKTAAVDKGTQAA